MRNMAQRDIAKKNKRLNWDNFQIGFLHVGISVQYLVNCDHMEVNRLVQPEISMHF